MSRVWIERLRVDGFGHFSGLDLPLARGLNLVFGENEAGKSTLLSFVRAMLFGFPSSNHPERYEPAEGPYGGELTLVTPQGPWSVRRARSKKVAGEVAIRAGGEVLPESLLLELLGGSRAFYQQIFAFGLGELASFEALAKERTVTEALSASAIPGARRLPEAIATLTRSAGELYAVKGRNPEINLLLSQLRDLQERIAGLGDLPRSYGALLERTGTLDRRVTELEGKVFAGEAELRVLERLDRVGPELARLSALEDQLSQLPARPGFPEAASDRWADLETRHDRHRRIRQTHLERIDVLERELSRVQPRLLPEQTLRSWRTALAAYRGQATRLAEAPLRVRQLTERKGQLASSVEALGLGLALEALCGVDLRPASRTELNRRRQALTQARTACADSQDALQAAQAQVARVGRELDEVERAIAAIPERSVAQLRAGELAAARISALRTERLRLEERLGELEGALAAPTVQLREPVLSFPASLLAGTGAALLLLAGAAWLLAGRGAGLVAAGMGAVLVAGLVVVQRRLARAHVLAVEDVQAELRRREVALGQLRSERDRVVQAHAAVQRELAQTIEAAGLEGAGEPLTVARRQQELAAALRDQERRGEAVLRGSALGRERARLEQELSERGEALAAAQSRLEKTQAAVREWLSERGLAGEGELESVLERVYACAALQDQARALADDERAEQEEALASRAVVEALLGCARLLEPEADADAGLGMGSGAAVGPEVAAAALEGALRAQESWAREVVELEGQLRAARAAFAEAEQELTRVVQAREALLRAAGAEDGVVLRAREQEQLRRRAVERELAECAQRVRATARWSEEQTRREQQARGGPEEITARHRSLAEELQNVRSERDSAVDERGQLKAQLASLESGDLLRTLRAEEEGLRARLQDRIAAFAVERAALALLEQERRKHEEAQQPKLLAASSAVLSRLTGGRYCRVLLPESEGKPLRVRGMDGSERSAEVLSRGTREQLYLAFRIAVAQDLAERRAPLPIIVDDVLVNFDPARARRAVGVFAELARSHQVLAFTCHPTIREMFEEERAAVVTLSGDVGSSGAVAGLDARSPGQRSRGISSP